MKNGKTFKGEFKNNAICGFVEYINKQGIIHHGYMEKFKFKNKEAMIIKSSKCNFEGIMEFSGEKLMGFGKIKYRNGNYYEGETIECTENGWGILYRADNFTIKGERKNNALSGYCEILCSDRSKYFGWFEDNKKNGIGINITCSGVYSIGKYINDYKHGGCLVCEKGVPKFELWQHGFLTKQIEKKEQIYNYTNLVYPEYKYLCKANNKLLYELLSKRED